MTDCIAIIKITLCCFDYLTPKLRLQYKKCAIITGKTQCQNCLAPVLLTRLNYLPNESVIDQHLLSNLKCRQRERSFKSALMFSSVEVCLLQFYILNL